VLQNDILVVIAGRLLFCKLLIKRLLNQAANQIIYDMRNLLVLPPPRSLGRATSSIKGGPAALSRKEVRVETTKWLSGFK
jgi:hypothetical protein